MPLLTDELRAYTEVTDAYAAYEAYVKRIGDKAMSKPVFVEFWRGLKGLPRTEAKKSPRKPIERGQAWIPVKDALEASVNATPTHEKGVAKMATKTSARKGRLVSPFTYDDPDVAYAAYKKMPHTKSPNARVMGKREFMKVFPGRHAAAMAKQNADAPAPAKRTSARSTKQQDTTNTLGTVDTVLGESWQDADQAVIDALISAGYTMPEVEDEDEPDTDAPDPAIITALAHNATALSAYLSQFEGNAPTTTKAQRSNAKRYRQRTDRTELPGEGNAYAEDDDVAPASNAVLWALNTEGLLAQAYERAEENGDVLGTDNAPDAPYITQAIGKGLLTEVFGPLPERTTNSA